MKKKLLILLPVLALLFGACNQNGNPSESKPDSTTSESETVTVEGVEISKTEATLKVGETLTLTATALPYTLDDATVTWSTSDPAIASVNDSGRVTALSKGSATITATANADTTKTATCVITVEARQVSVVAKTIDLNTIYTAAVWQRNLNQWLYFSGELVDSNGLRIKGDTEQENAVPVKFEDAGDNKYYVSFTKDGAKKYLNYEYPEGEPKTYTYDAEPKTKWDWHSEAYTITTPINGKTHYLGTYSNYDTISASEHEKNNIMGADQFLLRFYQFVDAADPTEVKVTPETVDVTQGGQYQLEAEILPFNYYTEETLKWSVSGNDKVTVDETGKVAVAEDAVLGSTATVTAKLGTLVDSATVTVTEKLNYGTLEAPLSVEEAKELIEVKLAHANGVSTQKVFVKGTFSSNNAKTQYGDFGQTYLRSSDGQNDKYFSVYSPVLGQSIQGTYEAENCFAGREAVISGWTSIYKGNGQLTNKNAAGEYDKPVIHSLSGDEPGETPDTPDTPVDNGWGTKENPLTIDQFMEKAASLSSGSISNETAYVKGLVSRNDAFNTEYNNYGDKIYFYNDAKTDGETIFAYRHKVAEGLDLSAYTAANSLRGKVLTLECKAENYYGALQMSKGGSIIAIEDGVLPVEPENNNPVLNATSQNNKGGYSSGATSWEENGITLTISKGSSTSWTADNESKVISSDHARAYKGTDVTISYTASMKTVIITTTGGNYVISDSLVVDGGTVAVNGKVATITVDDGLTSISFNAGNQIRITKIEVVTA